MSITTKSFTFRFEAECARNKQINPDHFYVWQMNDGAWCVSLLTSVKHLYYGSPY